MWNSRQDFNNGRVLPVGMMLTIEDNFSSEGKPSEHREGVTMKNFSTFSLMIGVSRWDI